MGWRYARIRATHSDLLPKGAGRSAFAAPVSAYAARACPLCRAVPRRGIWWLPSYSAERGGHAHMVSEHLNRHLTQPQREQFVRLLQAAADDAGLPTDPEFRSAFAAYLEWGSRIAVLNSEPGAKPADPS